MNTILHKASQRGYADHGWLKANHSFSFANYYDSEKIHFGKLRVLNDDVVAPGMGFDLHPHQDMEIITIPLSGALKHKDSIGNEDIIYRGDVQVMSAGSGIWHSEYNASSTEDLNLFQIWILTNQTGHRPRYDQKSFSFKDRLNKWQTLVSPKSKAENLWVHQNAFISDIETTEKVQTEYALKSAGNGVYFMVVKGGAQVEEYELKKRDALGCSGFFDPLPVFLEPNSRLLAIEVPMH